jgi:hypothetical protein
MNVPLPKMLQQPNIHRDQPREASDHRPFGFPMFAFIINARRNKLKPLVWERNGFVIWYKRLERHRFQWPRRSVAMCGNSVWSALIQAIA